MKWQQWLDQWSMTGLKLKTGFLDMEWKPGDPDRDAAWDLYIELLTGIATQSLVPEHGDEQAALDRVYKLFPLTREILRTRGRGCMEFTKIAVVVLNQVVRPFTAHWHPLALNGAFAEPEQRHKFRAELALLQVELEKYTRMLGDMAGVEDLTGLEDR